LPRGHCIARTARRRPADYRSHSRALSLIHAADRGWLPVGTFLLAAFY